MTTPCSPLPISASQIQTEFGGTNPIALNEYYGVAAGVPASGFISYNDLRCKSNLIYGSFYYNTPGTYYVTVPTGVASLGYMVQGAGGAGAAGWYSAISKNYVAGGGGASGEMRSGTFPVTPGQTLTIVVGAGGVVYAYGVGVGDATGAYQDDDGYPDNLANYVSSTGIQYSGPGNYSYIYNGVYQPLAYGGLGGYMQGDGGSNTTGGTGAINTYAQAPADYGGLGGPSYFGGPADWYWRYTVQTYGVACDGLPAQSTLGAGGCGGARRSKGSQGQNGASGAVWFTWNSSFGYPALYNARYGQAGGD